MTDPMIVASRRKQVRSAPVSGEASRSWRVLGWIGLVFLVVGGTDFAMVWIPARFGVAEWEFGAVSQSFNGLPILLLGLGFLTVAADVADRRWFATVALGGSVVLLLCVTGGALLWARHVQLALEAAPAGAQLDIRKAVAKTLVQAVTYSVALSSLVWYLWSNARRKA